MPFSLKTLLVKAVLQYLDERTIQPFLRVDWNTLDSYAGYLPSDTGRTETGGEIVLNLSQAACAGYSFEDNFITLQLSFSGKQYTCFVPTAAILEVFSRESNYSQEPFGIEFKIEEDIHSELKDVAFFTKKPLKVITPTPKALVKANSNNVVTLDSFRK